MPETLLDAIYDALRLSNLEVSIDGDHKSSELFIANGQHQIFIHSRDIEVYEVIDE
ncbi:hypothetical protein [Acaryochloris sp. CCMEE 5410]|uniref:hypothetical protein n=1 Tax=Acaryochloris sp. CCMEE 5410 TaxID=310037 RepID=UPI0002F079BE|nr:hypothetical protein [Acaryochloris sp. CCMEE 5410]KAI9130115.1 hypothetical protein ON05_031300 [Acaryochloris sp. CCMEE 5410]